MPLYGVSVVTEHISPDLHTVFIHLNFRHICTMTLKDGFHFGWHMSRFESIDIGVNDVL